MPECKINDCVKTAGTKDIYCAMHRKRLCRTGAFDLIKREPIISKILRKIIVNNHCWEYSGKKNNKGYGRFLLNNQDKYVHIYMYETIHNEIITDNKVIRHLCNNSKCCNPFHLRKGTQAENMQDRFNPNTFENGLSYHEKETAYSIVSNVKNNFDSNIDF